MQQRNKAWLLSLALVTVLATSTLAADAWRVVVQKAPLRQSPQVFGKIVADLGYGTVIDIQQRRNGWLQVRTPRGSGWLHESAVARRATTLSAGTKRADVAASQQELTLAGKGFNQQVEAAYRQKNRSLDYGWIDRMEGLTLDESQLQQFVQAGGLKSGGGDAH